VSCPHNIAVDGECLACRGFCRHGVPGDCYCRWCREGGEPEPRKDLTGPERAARAAEIKGEIARQIAEYDADVYKAGRDARVATRRARRAS
jgi:hypothetical protein